MRGGGQSEEGSEERPAGGLDTVDLSNAFTVSLSLPDDEDRDGGTNHVTRDTLRGV